MLKSRQRFLDKAKRGVKESFSRKDASLVEATRAVDDVDEIKSVLFQRLNEWVKINFPELSLGNEETICVLYAEFGCKEDFEYTRLQEMFGEEKASELFAKKEKSFGTEFGLEDKKIVQALASRCVELFKLRKELQEFVEARSRSVTPNLCSLLEPLLAARLVSAAGGLQKLALMPASTIQVLGAEKALFKHLRAGSQPPKHGIIFHSPLINAAPLHQRGKIARALATKLTIAIKADFYTGNDLSKFLRTDLEKRMKQIRAAPVDSQRVERLRRSEQQRKQLREQPRFNQFRGGGARGGRDERGRGRDRDNRRPQQHGQRFKGKEKRWK